MGRTVAAVAMVLLWRNDMWLLVGAGTAATFVLVRRWLADRLLWRPIRAALLALHQAEVTPDRAPARSTTVPDLAVEARGRTTVLDQAGDVLRDSDDLRRWAVGAERLAMARCFVTDTAPFPGASRRRRSAWTLGAWAMVTGLAAATVASGGGRWAPIVYVAAFTGTTAVLMALREERRLRPMLVAQLAGGLARSPYANRRWPALAHLEEARRMLPSATGGHRLNWLVLHVPYVVAGWVTWWATG